MKSSFVEFIAYLISLCVVIQACAISVPALLNRGNSPCLSNVVFCRSLKVESNSPIIEPIGEDINFQSDEEKIYILFSLKEVEGQHTMRLKWYTPDGDLLADSGIFQLNPDGLYHSQITIWEEFPIKNLDVISIKGVWTVAIYLDDKLITSCNFIIS